MEFYMVEYREKDLADYLSGINNCYYTVRRYFRTVEKAEQIAKEKNGKVIKIKVED